MAMSRTTFITCPSRLAKTTSDESIREICSYFIAEGGVPDVDEQGDTVLHFLSIYGNVHVLEALVGKGLLSTEDYLKKNVKGDTALHEAARFGQDGVARILVREERRLVWECNDEGETPVFVAAECGKEEVFELLKEYQSACRWKAKDGKTILHAAICRQHYYLALKILEVYPDLAHDQDNNGLTALHLLAKTPKSFRSGSSFLLIKLGTTFRVLLHIFELIIYLFVPAMYMERKHNIFDMEDPRKDNVIITKIKRSPFVKKLFSLRWLEKMDHAKQTHMLALALSRRLIQGGDKKVLKSVLIEAARNGVNELATEILRAWPDAALNSYDENGRNILLIAVESKQKYFYEHLKTVLVDHKERMMAEKDRDRNTILHLAAHVCDEIPNNQASFMPLLHLLWDVSWFHKVRRDLDAQLRDLENSEMKTAEEVFKESHGKLRDKAEKAMKTGIEGPMVVAALIATVNIAAIFTIPGGFNQTDGSPVLYTNKRKDLTSFMYYLWGTLSCATLSCGTLSILQIAPYHLNDFYFAVPLQLFMAGTALFYACCMTIVTILQAYILEDSMKNGHWIGMVFGLGIACIFYIDAAFPIVSHLIENVAKI